MWAWRRWSQPRPPRCRPTRLGATRGGPIGRAAATAPILLEAPAGVRSRTWGVNGDIPIAPRTRRRPTIGGGNANRGAPQRAKSATVLRDRPRSPRPLRRPRWRPRRRQSHRRRPRLHPPRVCRRRHSRHRSSASSGCRSRSSGLGRGCGRGASLNWGTANPALDAVSWTSDGLTAYIAVNSTIDLRRASNVEFAACRPRRSRGPPYPAPPPTVPKLPTAGNRS